MRIFDNRAFLLESVVLVNTNSTGDSARSNQEIASQITNNILRPRLLSELQDDICERNAIL